MPENIPSDNFQTEVEHLLSQKATILHNIGDLLVQQGNLFDALGYYHQALIDRHNRNDASEIKTINEIIKTAIALLNSKNSSSNISLSNKGMLEIGITRPRDDNQHQPQDDNPSDKRES